VRTWNCRSRMLLDAAPNGANRRWGGGTIKISRLRGLDGGSGVRSSDSGNRERNAASLRSLMHFYRLLAVFGILHGPTQFGDLLPERVT
jgi:hypothetical protein